MSLIKQMHYEWVTCDNVVDGDTIDCTIDLGFYVYTAQRLRLLRVDTPEINSKDPDEREAALRAKRFLQDILIGKSNISVMTTKQEKYGRFLAEVFLREEDGSFTSVNDLLLDNGMAKAYK